MSARGFAGAVLLALALSVPAARAENAVDVETARAYFVEATRLGKLGRWPEARELFARSLALKPSPVTRYSLGVAQRETGRYADALASFRAFLGEPVTSASAAYVEPAKTAIATLAPRVAEVTIVLAPERVEGLTLTIDGQPAAAIVAEPREIDPGAHELIARAPGFQSARAWFFAKAQTPSRVTLTLSPIVGETPPPPPFHSSAATPVTSGPSRALPIALLSGGGALAVAGVVVGIVGVTEASDAPTSDGPEARSARTKAITGDVLAGTGIVGAGVGLFLLLARPGEKKSSAIAPWSSGPVVGLQATF